ncbi:hypothetical protein PENTCL1PPCAC_5506, partial [Pristionchus entomophagus]
RSSCFFSFFGVIIEKSDAISRHWPVSLSCLPSHQPHLQSVLVTRELLSSRTSGVQSQRFQLLNQPLLSVYLFSLQFKNPLLFFECLDFFLSRELLFLLPLCFLTQLFD